MSHQAGDCPEYPAISSYALIGDCQTAALVSLDGSIDWYCPGRFDWPAVFCRLLDINKGGSMAVRPTGDASSGRVYLHETNVLQTTHSAASGAARVTDFMPVYHRKIERKGFDVGSSRRIIRLVEGVDGEIQLEITFRPTFDYGRAETKVSAVSQGAVAKSDGNTLVLSCAGVDLKPDGRGGASGRLTVRSGDRFWIAITLAEDEDHVQRAIAPRKWDRQLSETLRYWKEWSNRCTFQGRHRDLVLRSALTLKLLDYEPSGAIIAAPTTSLPEEIGGVRNWDYRYTWLRDSALILYALMTIGYQEEAEDFIGWLRRAQRSDPTELPQILYAVDGGRHVPEVALDSLEGYRCSRPVRIGNGAAGQFQLDVFGEVMRAAYLHLGSQGNRQDRSGQTPAGRHRPPSRATWALLRRLVEQAADRWQEPDRGIWEVRGDPQLFLYSRLMCWAALNLGVRLAEEFGLRAPVARWSSTRDAIRDAILARGYDQSLGAFTQAFGSKALDASALAIPRIGFLPPTDPRVLSTIDRIRERLSHNGLVYRYLTEDGLPGGEGTFALCSFWMVDALALAGRLDEAHDLFEKVISYTNDVGLMPEEINPVTGDLLGNYPQGFTHTALIGSAVNLAKAAKHGPEEHPETEAERAGRAKRAAAEGYSSRRSSSQASKP